MNFKTIHIGSVILEQVQRQQITIQRICKFFGYTPEEIETMYTRESLDSNDLLKWSKLLRYNLFLYYQNHLILYAPSGASIGNKKGLKDSYSNNSRLFRKNIYTQEIKDYMIDLVLKRGKTAIEVAEKYNIPKNTIYRWLRKDDSKVEKSISSQKKNIIPNYKVIFQDLAKKQFGENIPKDIQSRIEHLQNHLDILELNKLIFNLSYSSKETSKMKAYDRASIQRVLQTQAEEKLSNHSLALMFHLSRNTVAKWKKEYQEAIDN